MRRAVGLAGLLLLVCTSAGPTGMAVPVAGTLDPTFGDGGRVVTDLDGSAEVQAMAVGSGSVVVAWTSAGMSLVRYGPDGSRDLSFSTDGIVNETFEGYVADVGFDSSEAILVMVGEASGHRTEAVLERYLPTGMLDPTFGDKGRVRLGEDFFLRSMALRANGEIVLVGESFRGSLYTDRTVAVLRLDASGILDRSFGTNGVVSIDLGTVNQWGWRVEVLPRGKILVLAKRAVCEDDIFCRYKGVLMRLNRDGSVDTTYGDAGQVRWRLRNREPTDMALDSQGRVVILMDQGGAFGCPSGSRGAGFRLVAFRRSGTIAKRFGDDGRFSPGPIGSTALVIDADGRILVSGQYCATGSSWDFAVVRILRSGLTDPAFGDNGLSAPDLGTFNSRAKTIGLQADGNIVLAGGDFDLGGRIVLARYLAA